MTLHRLTPNQLVIKDCRRRKQDTNKIKNNYPIGIRKTIHDYESDKKLYLFWAKVEPQPEWNYSNAGKMHGRHSWNETIEKEIHFGKCPISEKDRIAVGDNELIVERVIGVEGKAILQPQNGESGLCNPRTPETVFYFFGIAKEVE